MVQTTWTIFDNVSSRIPPLTPKNTSPPSPAGKLRWGWVEIINHFHIFNIKLTIFEKYEKWEIDMTIKDWDLDHFIHIWDINILRKNDLPLSDGGSTKLVDFQIWEPPILGYLGDSSPNGNSTTNIERTILIMVFHNVDCAKKHWQSIWNSTQRY